MTEEFTPTGVTSRVPEVTEESTPTGVTYRVPEITEESTPRAVFTEESTATEITTTLEYTTVPEIIVSPNETIPSVIEQQFDQAGYPVDVTDIQRRLPPAYTYTACIPYHIYLTGLPHLQLQDLTRNNTAFSSKSDNIIFFVKAPYTLVFKDNNNFLLKLQMSC